jgi:uncharacterized phage-associated protein
MFTNLDHAVLLASQDAKSITPGGRCALAVADEFQLLAAAERRALAPQKLIALVYLAHGFMLVRHARPLVDETLQAWVQGPMIPSLHRAVRKFQARPVKSGDALSDAVLDVEEREVIEQTYRRYGYFTSVALMKLCQGANTPWAQVRAQTLQHRATIANELIRAYFHSMPLPRDPVVAAPEVKAVVKAPKKKVLARKKITKRVVAKKKSAAKRVVARRRKSATKTRAAKSQARPDRRRRASVRSRPRRRA